MSKNHVSLGTVYDKVTHKFHSIIEDSVNQVVTLDAKKHKAVWHPRKFTKRMVPVGVGYQPRR